MITLAENKILEDGISKVKAAVEQLFSVLAQKQIIDPQTKTEVSLMTQKAAIATALSEFTDSVPEYEDPTMAVAGVEPVK